MFHVTWDELLLEQIYIFLNNFFSFLCWFPFSSVPSLLWQMLFQINKSFKLIIRVQFQVFILVKCKKKCGYACHYVREYYWMFQAEIFNKTGVYKPRIYKTALNGGDASPPYLRSDQRLIQATVRVSAQRGEMSWP